MKLKLRNLFHDEHGQAVAELALALPVLLLVVLAIVDFGRFMNYWNDENHVANLGARAAAVGSWPSCSGNPDFPPPQASLEAYIDCEVGLDSTNLEKGSSSANGVKSPGVCISIAAPGAAVGSIASIGMPVTVTVKSTYNFLPWLGHAGINGDIAGTATMRLEQPLQSNVTNGKTC
jgi:hypothetical protein